MASLYFYLVRLPNVGESLYKEIRYFDLLRIPTDRTFSQHYKNRRRDREELSFREALEREEEHPTIRAGSARTRETRSPALPATVRRTKPYPTIVA